jgi:hypothetical protein
MTKLEIIEAPSKELFIESVEAFVGRPNCWIVSVKFQRNLFYKGIGSSAGRTPGSSTPIDESKLDESWVAFILWREQSTERSWLTNPEQKTKRKQSTEDTRFID